MRVNFIFQGGGANLATLLCAVEAIESLEREGFLTVSQVAGTSAGSIAAACLAHPDDAKVIIERIVSKSAKQARHFRLPSSKAGLIFKLTMGESILSFQRLESLVRDFFAHDGKAFSFKESRVPLFICAADIKRGRQHIFSNNSDRPIEEALAVSCSIPLVFHSPSGQSALADGGVMANLLDSSVFTDPSAHTLAFSFVKSEVNEYTGFSSYVKSVANSMIDNAVEEAKIRIVQSGGYVCELPRFFGTLGFDEALSKLGDDKFRFEVVERCKSAIRSGLEDFHSRSSLMAHGDRVGKLSALIDLTYRAIKEADPYKVTKCAICCMAYGLFSKSDPRSRIPDRMIKRVTIDATGKGLQFFRIGISRGSDFRLTNEISFSIADRWGKKLDASFEVVTNVEDHTIHRLCVVLKDRQEASNGPFTISVITSHQEGLMSGLGLEDGNEWMRAEAHRDDLISQQDLILGVPKGFPAINLTDLRANMERCRNPPPPLTEAPKQWVVGRPMEIKEIQEHDGWLQEDPGFLYVGWRTVNLAGHSQTGVLIRRGLGV